MDVKEFFLALLQGENPKTCIGHPHINIIKHISNDLNDLIYLFEYLHLDLLNLLKSICKWESFNNFNNIDSLGIKLNKRIDLEFIGDNHDTLIYLADKFNIKFYINNLNSQNNLIIHKNIKYNIRYDLESALDKLPRESIFICRENIKMIIDNDIILTEEELTFEWFCLDSDNITEEFIDKIPSSISINILEKTVYNLCKQYDFYLLNALFCKCNIRVYNIHPFIAYADELLNNVHIVWFSCYIDDIKINNNICYYNTYIKHRELLLSNDFIKKYMTNSLDLPKQFPEVEFFDINGDKIN